MIARRAQIIHDGPYAGECATIEPRHAGIAETLRA
jgi:hypothetical protein